MNSPVSRTTAGVLPDPQVSAGEGGNPAAIEDRPETNVAEVLPIVRRTELDPRVVWAAERTALAWLRTGLGLIAFGFVLARAPTFVSLIAPERQVDALVPVSLGVFLGGVGIAAVLAAARRHRGDLRALEEGAPLKHDAASTTALAIGIAVAGTLLCGWLLFDL